MKKSIFIISFIILSLFFSYSFVFAENAGEQVVNGVRQTVNGVENAAQDAANNTGNALQESGNNMKNKAQDAGNNIKGSLENAGNNLQNAGNNMMNSVENAGNDMMNSTDNMMNDDGYTASRTAAETNNNQANGWMNRDMWTWIIVGIITIVIVALIWYYASRHNQ